MREIVIGLACATAVTFFGGALACQVQGQCSTTPSPVEYCSDASTDPYPCQGHVIDATHWESGPQNAPFLNYGPEQLYHMHFRDSQSGTTISGELADVFIQVSASQQGNGPGNNWITCGDQLCIHNVDPDGAGIAIQNDTCGSYFFRVVVTLIPPTASDAGTD
jgi:hypothetical protein